MPLDWEVVLRVALVAAVTILLWWLIARGLMLVFDWAAEGD